MKNIQNKIMTPPYINYLDPENKQFLADIYTEQIPHFKEAHLRSECDSSNIKEFMAINEFEAPDML